MPRHTNHWEKDAFRHHPGAFTRQLGYSPGHPLPHGLVDEISEANLGTHVRGHKVTLKLKRRAVAVRNARR